MKTVPLSGLVLPVMMSISVVLPAPFGPIKQRSSPLSRINVRSVMALKPSKLTLTLSTTRTACRLPTTAARRSGSTKRGRTDQRLPLLSPGLGSGSARTPGAESGAWVDSGSEDEELLTADDSDISSSASSDRARPQRHLGKRG